MFQDEIIKKIHEEVQKKYLVNMKQIQDFPNEEYYKPYVNSDFYFHGMRDEIDEAEKESKMNNSVYLEDELGDILWDYMNVLYLLEIEGKITMKNVAERCLKKYSERTSGIEKGIPWDDIKSKQKQELKNDHDSLYN